MILGDGCDLFEGSDPMFEGLLLGRVFNAQPRAIFFPLLRDKRRLSR